MQAMRYKLAMEEFTPAPILSIRNLEALKILADPLRNQILEILAPAKLIVTQIAEKRGLSPIKLHYHINLLIKHGLIQEVDSIIKSNIIEKVYWITAFDCKMDENLCNFSKPEGQESVSTAMVASIETTHQDIQRSLEVRTFAFEQEAQEHPREVIIYRELRNMPDQKADEFIARLKAVIDDFEEYKNQEAGENVHTCALIVAFYPSFYHECSENGEDE